MSLIPHTYTVESVTAGHPDKLCDLLADTLLDAYLADDPQSRVAIEVLGGHRMIHLAGEVTSRAEVEVEPIVRTVLADHGYDATRFTVHVDLTQQSPEIAAGVDIGGAGDQGVMYGFATDETAEYLPKGVVLAHALTARLDELRLSDQLLPWLRPDGKSQVTIAGGKPTVIVLSAQHNPMISLEEVRSALNSNVIDPLLSPHSSLLTPHLYLNPAGPFTIGGFDSDTGLTGRKTQVDTYGGIVPHGGGGFSGKDPTKVDRSAAYMARFVAKQLVAQEKARECLVSVAYAIGEAKPVMLTVVDEQNRSLGSALSNYDFRPQAIIERLDLRRPIYAQATNAGHFGRSDLPWERIDSA